MRTQAENLGSYHRAANRPDAISRQAPAIDDARVSAWWDAGGTPARHCAHCCVIGTPWISPTLAARWREWGLWAGLGGPEHGGCLRQVSKSMSKPALTSFRGNHRRFIVPPSAYREVAPNDRLAGRWRCSMCIAGSGALRSRMLAREAPAGDCIATPGSTARSRSLKPARHEPPAGSSPRARRPHRSDGPARRCPCTCPHSPGRASGPSPHPERPRCRPRSPPS